MVGKECGMGSSASAHLAFTTKRLVREYGSDPSIIMGRLSISGTVSHMDVPRSFLHPTCYKLSIIRTPMSKCGDMDEVVAYLTSKIETMVEGYVRLGWVLVTILN